MKTEKNKKSSSGVSARDCRHIARAIGRDYQACMRRLKPVIEERETVKLTKRMETDLGYIQMVNTVIGMCTERNQFFLRKEIVEIRIRKWYVGYYAPSTYYRYRRTAFDEFVYILLHYDEERDFAEEAVRRLQKDMQHAVSPLFDKENNDKITEEKFTI